jgi:hypothetical protein
MISAALERYVGLDLSPLIGVLAVSLWTSNLGLGDLLAQASSSVPA